MTDQARALLETASESGQIFEGLQEAIVRLSGTQGPSG